MKEMLMNMMMKMVSGLKLWVVQMVMEAEKAVPGKSASEKRAYVVQRLDDMVKLPWYLEPFDGPAFGLLVDMACDKLNLLMGHEWTELTPAQAAKVAAVIDEPKVEAVTGNTVDERIEALYKKYGIK